MRIKSSVLIMIIAFSVSCNSTPEGIPTGRWKYALMVNDVKSGSALFSNEKSGETYISTSEMNLTVGAIENKSVQIIKETTDFKPLSLEIMNTVTENNGGKTQEFNKIATFNGKEVTLSSGDYKSKFIIEKPFVLDGNYFYNELLKNRFKKGTIIRSHIYEPTVELEDPILVIVEMMGYEDVDVNGKTKKLIHVKQKVEKLKSIDIYINEQGITEKVIIKMLNNIFALEKVD